MKNCDLSDDVIPDMNSDEVIGEDDEMYSIFGKDMPEHYKARRRIEDLLERKRFEKSMRGGEFYSDDDYDEK